MTDVFHYTSIDTLKLILRSRKVRFKRFDTLDDLSEVQTHDNITFAKFFFTSCWTSKEYECALMWDKYGDNYRGVRIGLPSDMFELYQYEDGEYEVDGVPLSVIGTPSYPLSLEQLSQLNCFPINVNNPEWFAGQVEYIADIAAHYQGCFKEENGGYRVSDGMGLPFKKSVQWESQQEFRYVIGLLSTDIARMKMSKTPISPYPSFEYVDLNLKQNIFDQLKIQIGPNCTTQQKNEVFSFASNFAPEAKIVESSLTGTLRAD